jgi:hypothetical protein
MLVSGVARANITRRAGMGFFMVSAFLSNGIL